MIELFNNLQNDFIVRALISVIFLSIMMAPLGCLIVWQRMVYFGDALSHTALLGAALGIVMGIQLHISVIIVCLMMALILLGVKDYLVNSSQISKNVILGIFAHTALALALIVLALQQNVRFDLYSFLFGNVLSVDISDLYWIMFSAAIVLTIIILIWNNIISITVHLELSQIDALPVQQTRLIFLLLIAITVAVAMKIVGVILIASLLIIPPASARCLSKTPEQMVVISGIFTIVAGLLGLLASVLWDLPSGPAIVLVAGSIFLLIQLTTIKNRR